MPSFTYVQLWELWRISRKEILWRLFFLTALSCGAQWAAQGLPDASTAVLGAFVWLIAFSSVFSATWMNGYENTRAGFSLYLGFTRPISTLRLVTIPMIYSATSSALCYLLSVGALGFVAQQPVPLLPVAAHIATIVFLFNMAVWSQQSRVGRSVAFAVVALTVCAILVLTFLKNGERFAESLANPQMLGALSFPVGHYLALLAIAVASVAVTVVCVNRQRHGLEWGIRWPSFDRGDWSGLLMRRKGPFRSAAHAQFWFEMRRAGVPIVAVAGITTTVLFFLAAAAQMMGAMPTHAAAVCLSVSSALLPLFLLGIGSDWLSGLRNRRSAHALSTFDATQPVGNGRVSAVKLTVLIGSVFLGWCLFLFAATVWGILFRTGQWGLPTVTGYFGFREFPQETWWYIRLATTLNYLALAPLFFSLGLFGAKHPKLAGALLLFHSILILLPLSFDTHRLEWDLTPLWTTYALVFAATVVAGVAGALHRGMAKGYLSGRYIAVSMAAWCGYVYAVVAFWQISDLRQEFSLNIILVGIGVVVLPLLAPALAPFAYAAHRHR